jgi:hypothetical protein
MDLQIRAALPVKASLFTGTLTRILTTPKVHHEADTKSPVSEPIVGSEHIELSSPQMYQERGVIDIYQQFSSWRATSATCKSIISTNRAVQNHIIIVNLGKVCRKMRDSSLVYGSFGKMTCLNNICGET